MRVNISYSIDLEEMIETASKLIDDIVVKEGERILDKVAVIQKRLAEESNVNEAIVEIKNLRSSLAMVDMRLSECSELLVGYQRILFNDDISSNKYDQLQKNIEHLQDQVETQMESLQPKGLSSDEEGWFDLSSIKCKFS